MREEIVRAQAAAAGLPLFTIPLPWPCTNEIYEARLRAAVERAVADPLTQPEVQRGLAAAAAPKPAPGKAPAPAASVADSKAPPTKKAPAE